MKKFVKYLLGAVALAVTVGGVIYFLKNVMNSKEEEDFDDFEEDFDDFDLNEDEEESTSENNKKATSDESRSYTTIHINKEDSEASDDTEEEI